MTKVQCVKCWIWLHDIIQRWSQLLTLGRSRVEWIPDQWVYTFVNHHQSMKQSTNEVKVLWCHHGPMMDEQKHPSCKQVLTGSYQCKPPLTVHVYYAEQLAHSADQICLPSQGIKTFSSPHLSLAFDPGKTYQLHRYVNVLSSHSPPL